MPNEHTERESTTDAGGRLERLVMRLRSLPRYDVGDFDEGDGYMCSYRDKSEDGDWISTDDLDELLKAFGA